METVWGICMLIFGFKGLTTTSCKIVETFPIKNSFSFSKSLLLRNLWDTTHSPSLSPFQSCPSKFQAWCRTATCSNFDKRGRESGRTIMETLLKAKWCTVSQIFLQLVVVTPSYSCRFFVAIKLLDRIFILVAYVKLLLPLSLKLICLQDCFTCLCVDSKACSSERIHKCPDCHGQEAHLPANKGS